MTSTYIHLCVINVCAAGGFLSSDDRLWKGTARAEDAQGTPAQSHISPSILVYEDKTIDGSEARLGPLELLELLEPLACEARLATWLLRQEAHNLAT